MPVGFCLRGVVLKLAQKGSWLLSPLVRKLPRHNIRVGRHLHTLMPKLPRDDRESLHTFRGIWISRIGIWMHLPRFYGYRTHVGVLHI